MKISEYNDMIKYITRPHKESKGAFQKEIDREASDEKSCQRSDIDHSSATAPTPRWS